MKLQARRQETHEEQENESKPNFGTQIVNYQPHVMEESSEDNGSKERIMSQAKRTFQGKNFANLQESYSIKIKLNDQKENSNANNLNALLVDRL